MTYSVCHIKKNIAVSSLKDTINYY